jgi:hypothetical protein
VKNWYERVSGGTAAGAYGGTDRVLRALSQEQVVKLYAREDYQRAPLLPNERYLSNAALPIVNDPLLGQHYIVLEGTKFYYYPQSTTTKVIIADAFIWWPNWTAGTDTDWWTTEGHEFLIWQAMVEANRLPMTFVGNVEGNLPPPVKEAQAALANLIASDKDSSESEIFIEDL